MFTNISIKKKEILKKKITSLTSCIVMEEGSMTTHVLYSHGGRVDNDDPVPGRLGCVDEGVPHSRDAAPGTTPLC